GQTVGETLAELGASVVILDRSNADLVAEGLAKQFNQPALGLTVDLANENEVRAAPAKIVAELGRLDIMVNCAAFVGTTPLQGWIVPFEQQSSDTWRMALEVNLNSVFFLCQAA